MYVYVLYCQSFCKFYSVSITFLSIYYSAFSCWKHPLLKIYRYFQYYIHINVYILYLCAQLKEKHKGLRKDGEEYEEEYSTCAAPYTFHCLFFCEFFFHFTNSYFTSLTLFLSSVISFTTSCCLFCIYSKTGNSKMLDNDFHCGESFLSHPPWYVGWWWATKKNTHNVNRRTR